MTSICPRSVGVALSRLRLGVIVCCWIVGLSLATQMFIWSLATFTDLRFEYIEEDAAETPMIIAAEPPRAHQFLSSRGADLAASGRFGGTRAAEQFLASEPRPVRVPSDHDAKFERVFNLASALGRCMMLALVPILSLGVIIGSGAWMPGVDRTISSFFWLLAVAVLVLPLGGPLNLPWSGGALTEYTYMTEQVDARAATMSPDASSSNGEASAAFSVGAFYARFGLLPLTCIIGITLVGLRFSASLEGALPQRENMRLDPSLEREASNVTPSSLFGGRASGAIRQVMDSDGAPVEKSMPGARQVSPGEAPKRLI